MLICCANTPHSISRTRYDWQFLGGIYSWAFERRHTQAQLLGTWQWLKVGCKMRRNRQTLGRTQCALPSLDLPEFRSCSVFCTPSIYLAPSLRVI
jgi:hypothetical protein